MRSDASEGVGSPSTLSPRRRRWLFALLVGGLPAAILLTHTRRYMPFISDDALISLRYAQRWLEGRGLTWTDGERVEGYSNFLWVVASAGLGALGVDLIDAVRILGVGCCVLCFLAVAHLMRPIDAGVVATDRARWFAAMAGGLFAVGAMSLSGPFAIWSVGGLEQTMVAAGLLWGVALVAPALEREQTSTRAALAAGVPLVMACLTRPDSPLFVALLSLALVVTHRGRYAGWRLGIAAAMIPAVAALGHLALRLAYYGTWLPNTAHVKARWSLDRMHEGLAYVGGGLLVMAPLVLVAVLGLWAALRGRRRGVATILMVWLVTWLAYIVSIGGDIFPGWRHLLIPLAALAVLAGIGVEHATLALARSGRSPRVVAVAVVTVSVGVLAVFERVQAINSENRRAIYERWEWAGQTVGPLLRDHFGGIKPYIAVTAAGNLPYFSELPALDMLGLNDAHIARQPPTQGQPLGHDRADGAYVLERAPDLIIFDGGRLKYAAGAQLGAMPRFHREYRLAQLHGFDPQRVGLRPHVRLAGAVGVTRDRDRIAVPGYLFEGATGQPGALGQMLSRLPARQRGTSPEIALPTGRWQVTVHPPDARVGLGVNSRRPAALLAGEDGVLEAVAPATLRIVITSGPIDGLFERVIITRTDQEPIAPLATHPDQERVVRRRPSLEPGPATLDAVIGAFEGGLDGRWEMVGDAFVVAPAHARWPDTLSGAVGGYLTSSGPEGGARLTGRLTSPRWRVPPNGVLSLRLAGGAFAVGVRLLLHGRTVMLWQGEKDSEMRAHHLDLAPFVGQMVQLQVFDRHVGEWGYLVLDEVELHRVSAKP